MTQARHESKSRTQGTRTDYARRAFWRIGLLMLTLDLIGLGVVLAFLWTYGPGLVPAVLLGGILGEVFFLITRSRLRDRVLAGEAAEEDWISAGGPKLRERLLRAYSPLPTVLLTLPYFLFLTLYGLLSLPWSIELHWERVLGGFFFSFFAVACLANGLQYLYFSWLAGKVYK